MEYCEQQCESLIGDLSNLELIKTRVHALSKNIDFEREFLELEVLTSQHIVLDDYINQLPRLSYRWPNTIYCLILYLLYCSSTREVKKNANQALHPSLRGLRKWKSLHLHKSRRLKFRKEFPATNLQTQGVILTSKEESLLCCKVAVILGCVFLRSHWQSDLLDSQSTRCHAALTSVMSWICHLKVTPHDETLVLHTGTPHTHRDTQREPHTQRDGSTNRGGSTNPDGSTNRESYTSRSEPDAQSRREVMLQDVVEKSQAEMWVENNLADHYKDADRTVSEICIHLDLSQVLQKMRNAQNFRVLHDPTLQDWTTRTAVGEIQVEASCGRPIFVNPEEMERQNLLSFIQNQMMPCVFDRHTIIRHLLYIAFNSQFALNHVAALVPDVVPPGDVIGEENIVLVRLLKLYDTQWKD